MAAAGISQTYWSEAKVKRYFSNIARQSGLRFAAQGSPSRAAGESPSVSPYPLSLIEREELVMVAQESEIQNANPQHLPTDKQHVKPSLTDKQRFAGSAAEKETAIGKQRSVQPRVSVPPPIREKEFAQGPQAMERTVFVEEPPSPQKLRAKNISFDRETSSAPPPKDHFTRTAEIVAGAEVEPQEVQTIVLHELQEWVAAGAADGSDDVVETEQMDIETHDGADIVGPEPGVVRISAERKAADRSETEKSAIEEAGFELSIGTINVTVEAENVVQAVAAPRSEQGPIANDDGRRFARLKRAFL